MVDHVTEGLAYLPSEFFDSPILKEVLKIYLERLQKLEDVIQDIVDQKNIDLAEGVQLDGIGEILGLKREGLTDSEFRNKLNIQKILNASEGTYPVALDLWKRLLGSNMAMITPEYPAGVALYSGVGISDFSILDIIVQSFPLTVTASITASYDADPAFCFEGGTGLGFGTTEDASIGGKFISRYVDTA
jgi:hypothetical protein